MKKIFFFNGIKDPAFNAIKDVLLKATLWETLVKICVKAQALLTPGKDTRYHHQNNKQSDGSKNKNRKNKDNASDKSDRHFLPPEVWKLMPPEAKKAWFQHGNDQGNKTTYKWQYDSSPLINLMPKHHPKRMTRKTKMRIRKMMITNMIKDGWMITIPAKFGGLLVSKNTPHLTVSKICFALPNQPGKIHS